jgi:hypothetical protein
VSVEPLTEAEYEPIRAALFDGSGWQSATEAKRKIAANLDAAGLTIAKKPVPYESPTLCEGEHYKGVACPTRHCRWNI